MMGIKERVFLCSLSRQYRKADRWKTVIAVAAIICFCSDDLSGNAGSSA